MLTKKMEQDALDKICEIIRGLEKECKSPDDSYILTALKGAIKNAALNIEWDAAFSDYDRAEMWERKYRDLYGDYEELRHCHDMLIDEHETLQANFDSLHQDYHGLNDDFRLQIKELNTLSRAINTMYKTVKEYI